MIMVMMVVVVVVSSFVVRMRISEGLSVSQIH